jgi:peptide/nickel transport system substrate-binding protein
MRVTLCVLLAATALAGCVRVAPTTTRGEHAWTIPHVLRIADISDPDHLNPYLSEMDLVYDLSSLIYSYLVIADDRGRLIGDLATEVPSLENGGISGDGLTYTYHLRRGVFWHDGVPFTSKDVVASWHAVVNPHNDTLFREGYDRVASIGTPDDHTIVVHLRQRYPPFVTQFFAPLQEGGKPILPAHVIDRDRDFNRSSLDQNPIGTGPFRFVSWQRGSQITLERFDRYFKGMPKLDRIELHIIPDDDTIATQVRVHAVDLVVSPPGALFDEYRSFPQTVTELRPWNAQEVLILNDRQPGLGDVAVRRAIASAVDYDSLIRKVSHNVGETAYNTLPPTASGYQQLSPHAYDPALANRLLDDAGWVRGSDGIRSRGGVRLAYTIAVIAGSTNLADIALQLQQNLQAVGIDIALKTYPYNAIFSTTGPIFSGTYDLAIYSTTLGWDPDVHFYVGCDQWYPRGQNVYGYCDHALDALENAGLQTDDLLLRAAYYRSASEIMWQTISYLPLYELRRPVVRSPDLRNFSTNPSATPWWNAWQWDI